MTAGIALGLGMLVSDRPRRTEAAVSGDLASELIDAVNRLRASYGLSPYVVDPILMSVALNQNNYSLSIGQITHYGPDGSRPREQAIAAGYGGGATVFISENIAMGTGLTPEEAVASWTGDAPHLNTMIGANYRDVGGAAGEDDGATYYTLVAGYVAGGYSARSTSPASGPAALGPAPVARSTPLADGSIVHVVEPGQTMWTIAAVYDVELDDVRKLNGLTESSILHPGDRLIIRAGAPVASTTELEPTVTPGDGVTGTTRVPTRTPSRAVPSPATDIQRPLEATRSPTSLALIVAGLAVLAAGIVLGSRKA
ncbi:MAG: hypothetical protein A2Z17_02495 [Gammaproteobacteria bacterium RBG_16_66_13]|nr:MAG: hypothetical protein A2Z17_02495 [Gammaproteobacteria bacterium RBG_16_66_13]